MPHGVPSGRQPTLTPAPDPSNLANGDTLADGRYTVMRRLGRGGMGVVYEVCDHRMRDKRFALKALSSSMSSEPGALDSLMAEVLTAQGLHHPNIIAVHDMVDDHGGLFIKMELIEGESLRDIQRREGPQPPDRVVEWLLQCCDGFAYAHDQHVVHADIKPANLMLAASTSQIKIADFGLAVVLDDQYSHHSLGGVQAGTINYMSPEQYMGLRLSRRSDIYSLACSAWSLLAGKPPFSGAGLQYQLLHQPPPPAPGAPDWLNEVLGEAMAKDDRARPADVRHFQRMLVQRTIKPRSHFNAALSATPENHVAIAGDDDFSRAGQPDPAAGTGVTNWASSSGQAALCPQTPDLASPALHGDAFALLETRAFTCPNNVDGDKTFRLPVYRSRLFAEALALAPDETSPEVEFVLLPPPGMNGRYVMGSSLSEYQRGPDEGQHDVCVSRPFLAARTAVSQRLYAALGPANSAGVAPVAAAGGVPACNVSWTAAVNWLRRNGLRMPSEAEWEFACRAGTTSPFCTGNQLPPDFANFDGNYPYQQQQANPRTTGTWRQHMVDVASLGHNAFGMIQMHGNVCEWVADCYCGNYELAPVDGSPLEAPGLVQRVIRGGSWTHLAQACRSAARFPCDPSFLSRLIGFRPVVSVDLEVSQ